MRYISKVWYESDVDLFTCAHFTFKTSKDQTATLLDWVKVGMIAVGTNDVQTTKFIPWHRVWKVEKTVE
jgi:hypothetical protein